MSSNVNWPEAIQPLLKKYKDKQHPLEYKNIYQLVVMVVLSAQDSDRNINSLAPKLFEAFPNMEALSKATETTLQSYISKVRNFGNKTKWLMEMSQKIKTDKNIPLTLEELTALPGIGRKSANVILREAGKPPAGVIVDLHVVQSCPKTWYCNRRRSKENRKTDHGSSSAKRLGCGHGYVISWKRDLQASAKM